MLGHLHYLSLFNVYFHSIPFCSCIEIIHYSLKSTLSICHHTLIICKSDSPHKFTTNFNSFLYPPLLNSCIDYLSNSALFSNSLQLPTKHFTLSNRHTYMNFFNTTPLSRSLRSASQHLLTIPRIDSANGRRFFSFSAPS